MEQDLEREVLDLGRPRLDAEGQVDDAVALGADVEVVKPVAVARLSERPLQEAVDGAVPATNRQKFNVFEPLQLLGLALGQCNCCTVV